LLSQNKLSSQVKFVNVVPQVFDLSSTCRKRARKVERKSTMRSTSQTWRSIGLFSTSTCRAYCRRVEHFSTCLSYI